MKANKIIDDDDDDDDDDDNNKLVKIINKDSWLCTSVLCSPIYSSGN